MNTSAVVPFYFQSLEIRTLTLDNKLWFVAKDVCDVLGIANPRHALSRIPENHKSVAISDTLGGSQQMSSIDGPGLYRLILRSNKPRIEPLMEWVTAEVLP